ncbi:hypothetical protein L1049_015723 [Liquidambar formosana]|uniref:Uncharacterized protein n=1 Tax=Liquidambar formosana TaxID=63359 RepID=A0AAP0RY20_LIQFO
MGENLRQNIPSPSPDLESMEGCRSELTRANSEDSSASKDNSSKHFSHRNGIATSGQSTDWTDEKHSLYLDSLEASFVNQLHHSMGFLASHSQEKMWDPNSSRKQPAKTRNSSDEFTVLRGGCWQKLKF